MEKDMAEVSHFCKPKMYNFILFLKSLDYGGLAKKAIFNKYFKQHNEPKHMSVVDLIYAEKLDSNEFYSESL